jgi:hypothetical protein
VASLSLPGLLSKTDGGMDPRLLQLLHLLQLRVTSRVGIREKLVLPGLLSQILI